MSKAIERLEALVGSLGEDDAQARHPVRELPVDQVSDIVERAPRVRALFPCRPRGRDIGEQRLEHARGALREQPCLGRDRISSSVPNGMRTPVLVFTLSTAEHSNARSGWTVSIARACDPRHSQRTPR